MKSNLNPMYLIETSPARILKVANNAIQKGAEKADVLDRLMAMKARHAGSKFAKYANKIHHKANTWAIDQAIKRF